MPLDPDALFAHDFGQLHQRYDARDAILYALGVGLGSDPLSASDLAFLDERKLSLLPSFAVTLATPGMWIRAPEFGVDFGKLVHFEQTARFPQPLPPSAGIIGDARVTALTDRGEGKGAVLVLERNIRDADDGALYCQLHQTLLLRGDGGFGGPPSERTGSTIPDRECDTRTSYSTSPRAALIYRLSGDWNPLHLDPDIARSAGFERPILHGLASYGLAGVAASRASDRNPADISELGCRFSGVVFPGDTLEFQLWQTGSDSAVFQAFVGERKVLDQGRVEWRNN